MMGEYRNLTEEITTLPAKCSLSVRPVRTRHATLGCGTFQNWLYFRRRRLLKLAEGPPVSGSDTMSDRVAPAGLGLVSSRFTLLDTSDGALRIS